MHITDNIFASNSERQNYYHIEKNWGDNYNIYQNIPFLNLVKVGGSEIEPNIFDYLKKTSVDYVICDKKDKPLIGIEFDGLQQGFNVGQSYNPKKGFDKNRKFGLETKLDIAYECKFPLFVVSDDEFQAISQTHLTIVDGLIGTILTEHAFKKEFHSEDNFKNYLIERYGLSLSDFKSLPRSEGQDIVESYGTDIEVNTEFDNNPIVRKRWAIHSKLSAMTEIRNGNIIKGTLLWGWGGWPTHDRKRFTGGKASYTHKQYGTVEKQVILPNFHSHTSSLAIEIAGLLAVIEMAKRMGVDVSTIG